MHGTLSRTWEKAHRLELKRWEAEALRPLLGSVHDILSITSLSLINNFQLIVTLFNDQKTVSCQSEAPVSHAEKKVKRENISAFQIL